MAGAKACHPGMIHLRGVGVVLASTPSKSGNETYGMTLLLMLTFPSLETDPS